MAQYPDIIGGLSDGTGIPAGFTNRWGSGDVTYTVSDDVDAPNGKRLNVSHSESRRRLVGYDGVNADTDRDDGEVVALVRNNNLPGSALHGLSGPLVRGSFDSSQETGLAGVIRTDSSNAEVGNYEYDGGSLDATEVGSSHEQGVPFWIHIAFSGADFTVTFYENDGDAFGAQIGQNPRSDAIASNVDDWIGIFSFSSETDVDYLYMSIGTGADSAPMPGSEDTTAPTLSSPSGTETGATTADLSVSTDEDNGTLYWIVSTSATPPSVAQIQAGNDSTGSAATDSGNQSVSATGAQNANATGLTAETTYYAYFQHTDAANNDSTVADSASFTTDAAVAVVKGIQLSLKQSDGATAAANLTGLYYHAWDALNPGGASDQNGSSETTDASGVLEIDIDSFAASVGGEVFLVVYDLDGTEDKDSVCFAGRVPVVDIS